MGGLWCVILPLKVAHYSPMSGQHIETRVRSLREVNIALLIILGIEGRSSRRKVPRMASWG
jgi:hypothetical protein